MYKHIKKKKKKNLVVQSVVHGIASTVSFGSCWASLVAQRAKTLPAIQKTEVQSVGREDPLENEMATHSSILAWRIPWTEEPDGLSSMGLHKV